LHRIAHTHAAHSASLQPLQHVFTPRPHQHIACTAFASHRPIWQAGHPQPHRAPHPRRPSPSLPRHPAPAPPCLAQAHHTRHPHQQGTPRLFTHSRCPHTPGRTMRACTHQGTQTPASTSTPRTGQDMDTSCSHRLRLALPSGLRTPRPSPGRAPRLFTLTSCASSSMRSMRTGRPHTRRPRHAAGQPQDCTRTAIALALPSWLHSRDHRTQAAPHGFSPAARAARCAQPSPTASTRAVPPHSGRAPTPRPRKHPAWITSGHRPPSIHTLPAAPPPRRQGRAFTPSHPSCRAPHTTYDASHTNSTTSHTRSPPLPHSPLSSRLTHSTRAGLAPLGQTR